MKQIQSVFELRSYLKEMNKAIGFVPTMGSLHEGHLELIKKSIDNNDITIVSIFVNPTQFNEKGDFDNYPKDLEKDFLLLTELGVDIVFTPNEKELYQDGYDYRVCESNFSKVLCGKERQGHFDGVLTVVIKLINLTQATNVYFGEKDFQQYQLIKGMVAAFFINTNIIALPTVRDKDGLALSSRNERLSPKSLKISSQIYKNLKSDHELEEIQKILETEGFEIEYLEEVSDRRYIAARIENIRLIDNVKI